MQIKNELRKSAKDKRKGLENTVEADAAIAEILFSSEKYIKSDTILIYDSLDDEISTDCIINRALADGKRVALPFCTDREGNMDFYIIESISQLVSGSFNVREPDVNLCERLDNFDNSVIIVPGLLFDKKGNRLGYGRGYYDRFLSRNRIFSVGLCYDEMLSDSVPNDSNDRKVDMIITQSGIIRCNNGGRNG